MALAPHDIREFLEDAVEYPTDAETVIDEIGHVEIDAPDAQDSETIADLLDGIGSDRYESGDELNQTLHAMMPDEYIGRKYYDDRSDEVDDQGVKEDTEDQSF